MTRGMTFNLRPSAIANSDKRVDAEQPTFTVATIPTYREATLQARVDELTAMLLKVNRAALAQPSVGYDSQDPEDA